MVYGSYRRIEQFDGEERIIDYQYPLLVFLEENQFADRVYSDYSFLQAATWNFLIKTDVYLKNNIRHKAVNYWEDFSTTIDLPSYVTRVVMIPDITYFYYCRYGSLSNFSKRNHIDKQEIQKTIDAMALVKQNTDRLKQKPYFHKRMYKVMATHLYMALAILEQRKVISPPFSMREMRDVMRSPLTFRETIKLKGWWAKNVALYLLGVLPPLLTVGLFWVIYPYFKAVEKRKEKYANVVHAK